MQSYLIRILIYTLLFVFISNNRIIAQSRIDSIKLEVETLNINYKKKLTELYNEMLLAVSDKNIPSIERYRSQSLFHLFPIDENITRLLDSLDTKGISLNNSIDEEYPYAANYGSMIYTNERTYPALIYQLIQRLKRPQSKEKIFLFSICFESFFYSIGMDLMSREEKAKCIRIMANSFQNGTLEKENLLKIAYAIEGN